MVNCDDGGEGGGGITISDITITYSGSSDPASELARGPLSSIQSHAHNGSTPKMDTDLPEGVKRQYYFLTWSG